VVGWRDLLESRKNCIKMRENAENKRVEFSDLT
jgi:hypothetical protein